jgi:hypothetical protein
MKNALIIFSLFVSFTFSCTPSRFVKPLEKGEHAVQGTFGGPVINVPGVALMPIPFTSIGYGFGIDDKTTVYGGFHTTASAFGVMQMDMGVTRSLLNDSLDYGVSISPGFTAAMDIWENNTKFWPTLDANFYWKYGKKFNPQVDRLDAENYEKGNFFYFGFSNWFELQRTRAHGEPQPHFWIFNPHVGHTFVKKNWLYTMEFKFLAPNVSNERVVTDYAKIFGNRGAMGIYLGVSYKF